MRILIIAPSDTGYAELDTIPEVQAIQEKHTTFVLSGRDTTYEKVFDTARRWRCDAVHVAGHSDENGVPLSGGGKLSADDLAMICRLCHATMIMFNSCYSGKLASYCVRHGVAFAFFANVKITDSQAWRYALGFYNSIENGNSGNVLGAYKIAASDDGLIGWTMNPDLAAPALYGTFGSISSMPSWAYYALIIIAIISIILSVTTFVLSANQSFGAEALSHLLLIAAWGLYE